MAAFCCWVLLPWQGLPMGEPPLTHSHLCTWVYVLIPEDVLAFSLSAGLPWDSLSLSLELGWQPQATASLLPLPHGSQVCIAALLF